MTGSNKEKKPKHHSSSFNPDSGITEIKTIRDGREATIKVGPDYIEITTKVGKREVYRRIEIW